VPLPPQPDDDDRDFDRRQANNMLISWRLGKVEERLERLCEQIDRVESRLDKLDRDFVRRDELIGNYDNKAEMQIAYVPRAEHMQHARERWIVLGGVTSAVTITNIILQLILHH
jgi:hypothetical protein